MKMKGKEFVPAKRDVVWVKLQDIDILKDSIKGCQKIEWADENTLLALVKTKVGPINAKFKTKIILADMVPPEKCTMRGEGQGGVSGFAKGNVDVVLNEKDGGTEISYDAKATVGGKMAQLGARLLNNVARKMADDFFKSFSGHVTGKKAEKT